MSNYRQYTFNSALTPLDENGAFKEKDHDAAVRPLRAKIMELDGTCGCHIARYDVRVDFIPEAVTPTAVYRHVQAVFADAAASGQFFQGLGNKKLHVTRDVKPRRRTGLCTVEIRYPTSLIAFPVGSSEKAFDRDRFDVATKSLALTMTDQDGVLHWQLHYRWASLKIDTSVVSVEFTKEHLKQVFAQAVRTSIGHEGVFFPYVEDGQVPDFTFAVKHEYA